MKKLLALLLAVTLMAACAVSASAATTVTRAGDPGETPVELTAEAATFNVTVPTSIAIKVKANGDVECPTNVAITNNSTAAVKVTSVSMTNGSDGWTLVSYDNTDWPTQLVDSKKLGFSMTAGDNTIKTADNASGETSQVLSTGFDSTKWGMAQKGATLAITCAAKASALSSGITTAQNAANIVFTVAWASA